MGGGGRSQLHQSIVTNFPSSPASVDLAALLRRTADQEQACACLCGLGQVASPLWAFCLCKIRGVDQMRSRPYQLGASNCTERSSSQAHHCSCPPAKAPFPLSRPLPIQSGTSWSEQMPPTV